MSEWTAVSDRLPDFDVPVFIWPQAGVFLRSNDTEGWLWANCYDTWWYDDKKNEWAAWDAECDDDYEPTHWMPLPEPPK
jgi:hypothetical protein